jgi:hypothetical protein
MHRENIMDMNQYIEYGLLTDRELALKAELKEVSEKKKELGDFLLDEMADNGMEKMTVRLGEDENGQPVCKTLFVRRQLWAGHKDGMEKLIAALKDTGYSDLVGERVNTNTLSAMVRELDANNNLDPEDIIAMLPERLAKAIKVTAKVELRARNA